MRLAKDARAAENVTSSLLPGGSLISAALHRQVMIWSDRGGASRHIGDRWAVRSWNAIGESIGSEWPVPFGHSFRILHAIRLDDVPQVSREANLQQTENPDFLLIGVRDDSADDAVLQAADAKFAADRIKPSQVSVQVSDRLLTVVGSARTLVEQTLADLGLSEPSIVRGIFVCPDSALTDFLMRKALSNRETPVHASELVRVPADPGGMFVDLPMTRLVGPLARIDALPVSPRSNLISAIYYFRLACACMFLWGEGNRPLLSAGPNNQPEPGIVAAELALRSTRTESAWSLVRAWATDIEPQVQAREAISNVATLPIRMRDLRAEIERAGRGDQSGFIRFVRKELDIRFRQGLLERTGEIAADDPRPLPKILDDVAGAARAMRPELSVLLTALVQEGRPEAEELTSGDTPTEVDRTITAE